MHTLQYHISSDNKSVTPSETSNLMFAFLQHFWTWDFDIVPLLNQLRFCPMLPLVTSYSGHIGVSSWFLQHWVVDKFLDVFLRAISNHESKMCFTISVNSHFHNNISFCFITILHNQTFHMVT